MRMPKKQSTEKRPKSARRT